MSTVSTAPRESSIDILRFIGISCIILAHIGLGSKTALYQIRTFDVPLMIFLSGLAYSGKQTGNYLRFVWKRLTRLIVPVYIFLIVYFAINFLLAQTGLAEQIALDKIFNTFILRHSQSIGYVWIIRVFLIIMLLTPPLMALNRAIRRDWIFAVLIAAMLVGQNLLVGWLRPLKLGHFVNDYLLYALGYSALFLLGLRMKNAEPKTKIAFTLLAAAAFTVMAFGIGAQKGTWLCMQSFKYPPQAYYLLWGATVGMVLWTTKDLWQKALDCRPIRFIGQNTIWIYLWHIPFVAPVKAHLGGTDWWWRYLIVYAAALGCYYLQYRIVDRIERRNPQSKNSITKYLKG